MPNDVKYGICLAVLAIIVVVCDRFFPILKDVPAGSKRPLKKLSYSLGRVQMAFWTVIVIGSLIYIRFILDNGSIPVLDSGIITLMGISGATGLAAGAVDVAKDKEAEAAKAAFTGAASGGEALDAQIVAALIQRGAAGQRLPNGPLVAKLFADRTAQTAELSLQAQTVKRSKRDDRTDGFIKDLLTDQNGNSLHRLQLIFFTVIIGAHFVVQVASEGALAKVLSDQLLQLVGVSGGVYAGFKLPGKAT